MFHFHKSNKRYYTKIILYFVFFTVLLTSLLSVLLYTSYRNYSLELINHSNQDVLKQISENMGEINSHSSIYINSIFTNPSTTALMYNSDSTVLEYLNDIRAVQSLLIAHPYVHSIYIYNAQDNIYHIIGEQTLLRKEKIYDGEIEELLHNNAYVNINPVPRKIPYSEREQEKVINVYTYILKDIKSKNNDRYFSVVVNVRASAFFSENTQRKSIHNTPGEIYCVNASGYITGSINPEMFLETAADKPYIDTIMNKKEGYFVTKDHKNQKIITFIKAPVADWILVNEVPYSYVVGLLDKVKTVTMMIILINLSIGCIIAFLLSRSLYLPIDRLKKALKQDEQNKEEKARISELDMIAVDFQKMQVNINKLESLNRDTKQYIKNGLLLSLLENSIVNPLKIKEIFVQHDIKVSLEHPALIIILRIDHYQKQYVEQFTGELQSLYKFALNNITLEVIGDQYPLCESFDPGEDYTVTIISLQDDEIHYEDLVKDLESCIRKIQKNYYDFIQVSVSGFISAVASNLYEVGEIYNEGLELGKQRFLYGHGCIINSLHSARRQNALVDEEQTRMLMEALKTSNYEEILKIYYEIMDKIKDSNYDNILFAANYLSSVIVNTILFIEKNTKVHFNIDYMEFNRRILNCETKREMDKFFEEIFEKITDSIENVKNNRSDDMVDKVNQYIEDNYMFERLCTADIADYVGLTQRYLNRVYRQGFGRSISDYIKEVRLNHAAKLLLETDDTIDKILEQIGWTTQEYFYSCFKKQYGVTPGDYRSQK